jgi:uncharacterized protein (DUF3084 family)
MAGYTLIFAVLVLGGIIATLGDRIGSKVGKARLTVFRLRPRHTATLITIVTGGLIAASTLGILLASSSQLQDGLFRLESIRAELETAQQQRQRTETQLQTAKSNQATAQLRLDQINRSLARALIRQSETQTKLQELEQQFDSAQSQLASASAQEQQLRDRIDNLNQEQDRLLTQQQQLQSDLSRISSERASLRQKVNESEQVLQKIEQQRATLREEVASLEESRDQLAISIQTLRRGNVAIFSEQILSLGVIRPELSRDNQRAAIQQLILQAERSARELLDFLPGQQPQRPVLQVSDAQTNRLLEQMRDGRSYVIRILSAGNYIRRETNIFITVDITPNRQVFEQGQVIASLTFRPDLSLTELETRVEQLFSLASFRARREGVLFDPLTGKVGSFSPAALSALLQSVSRLQTSYEIQAVAKNPIFTGSPLSLELVVRQGNTELGRYS